MYRITLTELAAQTLKGIETTARGQIIEKIEQLKDEPALLGVRSAGNQDGGIEHFVGTLDAARQVYRVGNYGAFQPFVFSDDHVITAIAFPGAVKE